MKIKLYLDFDGVILDTINVTYKEIKELNITLEEDIQNYYRNVDWYRLIRETDQINNSIDNIKKIIDTNLYEVEILTHVNSDLEGKIKKEYIKQYLPNTRVIPVFKQTDKCDAVRPNNCILIDDFIDNLIKWDNKGGISIKFLDNTKQSIFPTIDNLSTIIDMYDDILDRIGKGQVV